MDDREIRHSEQYDVSSKLTVFHEYDYVGNHRLRCTNRVYRSNTPNRREFGDWVPFAEDAVLYAGGGYGNCYVATHNQKLPPLYMIWEIVE